MDAQCTHGSDRKTVSWAQGKRRSALAFVAARASAKRVDHIFARLVSEGVLWREKSAQGGLKTQSRESLYLATACALAGSDSVCFFFSHGRYWGSFWS